MPLRAPGGEIFQNLLARVQAALAVDALDVAVGGGGGDVERFGHLLLGVPQGIQGEHIHLPVGQEELLAHGADALAQRRADDAVGIGSGCRRKRGAGSGARIRRGRGGIRAGGAGVLGRASVGAADTALGLGRRYRFEGCLLHGGHGLGYPGRLVLGCIARDGTEGLFSRRKGFLGAIDVLLRPLQVGLCPSLALLGLGGGLAMLGQQELHVPTTG